MIPRGPEYLEEDMDDQNDYRNIESPDIKVGQIKKVEFSNPSIMNEGESEEISNIKDSQERSLIRDSIINHNIEKIDMIDPEKLSELLSSKKKHRYQEVKDSMDGIAETNIHQQINFTDEEENLNLHEYHSPGVDSPNPQQSIAQNIEDTNSALPCRDNTTDENEDFQPESLNPEKEYIIESMTYQQIQEERNNLIEDVNFESEHQTVINCTQSDQEDSSEDLEERLSDRNAIIDESSLEYPSIPQDYNPISEAIHEEQNEPTEENHEERVFEYLNEQTENLTEGENEEPEITSRKEIIEISENEQHSEHSEPNYYPDSNESYSDVQMDEGAIDQFLNEPLPQNQDKSFDKTLTNMRLAFGSEKHIRENSVKTLERIDQSQKDSGSGEKTEEKSSVFEKNSFQDFSLKKFTELMNVKNMKNFKTSMQKTFREYSKANIFTNSDKKTSKMSSTPKKSSCISPRKFSMKDLELDRIGYEKMKENSEKKNRFIQNIMGSSSSQNKQSHSSILYKTNLSFDKCRKEINMEDISDDHNSSKNIEYKISSPHKSYQLLNDKPEKEELVLEDQHMKSYNSPEVPRSAESKISS